MYPRRFWNNFRLTKWINKIFVAMSFDQVEVEKRYMTIIKPAIEEAGFKPYFLKDKISGNSITTEILTAIIECKLLLFDISIMEGKTYRNHNVMYELGLAHAWREPGEVITVRDDDGKLPFDVTSIGVYKYNRSKPTEAISEIKGVIEGRDKDIKGIRKAIVIKARESLDKIGHDILIESNGREFHLKKATVEAMLATFALLQLGLIELKTDIKGWGYFPTDLGREVIRSYGIKVEHVDFEARYKTLNF